MGSHSAGAFYTKFAIFDQYLALSRDNLLQLSVTIRHSLFSCLILIVVIVSALFQTFGAIGPTGHFVIFFDQGWNRA